jgi:hypothetical protein
MCTKNECPAFGKKTDNYKYAFDIQLNLSDETGSLNRVKTASKCIEKILSIKVILVLNYKF